MNNVQAIDHYLKILTTAHHHSDEAQAAQLAVIALRKQGEKLGEPLSLEKLCRMDGQPVWSDDGEWSAWGIVSVQNITPGKEKVFFCGSRYGLRFMFDVERQNLKLYPLWPIERHAFAAEWKGQYKSGQRVEKGCVCSNCDMWHERPSKFCPECGLPMTPEAREMLEMRLRGEPQ